MSFELLLTYSLITTSFLLIPGPTLILVISYSLFNGRKSLVYLVLGVGLGDLTAITLAFLGLGFLLEKTTSVFNILKWLGALYLIWIGIKMWLFASNSEENFKTNPIYNSREIFFNSYITTALNPKSIVFFFAFIPQFINPILPFFTQAIILGGIFIVLAIISVFVYANIASFFGEKLRLNLIKKWTQRVGGILIIIAASITALNI